MDGWLDESYLHTINDKDVVAQLDEILLLLIAIRDGACGKNSFRTSVACSART